VSSSSAGVPTETALFVLAIIILLVIRRIYRNFTGVKISEARTVGYTIFYFAFGGFFVATSFFEGISYLYAVPDVIVLILAAIWSYRFADRRITFWRGQDGSLYYKGGIIIYLIYVVGLIARLAIDFVVIGPSSLTFSFSGTLSGTALLGTTITDLLLMLGIGLLVGRNIRVYQRVQMIKQGKQTLPSTPGSLGT
jgi:hypothetical protein